jgi:hypothetical protein
MAHTRKDTLVKPPEWYKHLRWKGKGGKNQKKLKQVVSKREREAAKKEIRKEIE